jgi:hypothetical protein
MSDATCVLRASGTRFAAKKYLATSTFVARLIGENAFEFAVSEAAASDRATILADAERFLTSPKLTLDRLLGFPGVEKVQFVFRVVPSPSGKRAFALPPRVCGELARHRLELVVEFDPGKAIA